MKTKIQLALLLLTGTMGALALFPSSARPDPSNSAWQVFPSPNVGSQDNVLIAVAGSSRSDVWAVGQYVPDNGTNHTNTLALHYNGSAWSVVPSPSAPDTATAFLSVTAAYSRAWAVGYGLPTFFAQSLIAAWDGSHWTLVPHPQPGMSDMLFAVEAVSDRDVWAAGWRRTDDTVFHTLVEHFDGTKWTAVPTPDPGALGNQLYGLHAIASNDIWAVGQKLTGTGPDSSLVLHWNGSSWTEVNVAPMAKAGTELLSVAGHWAGGLLAVGESQDYVQSSRTFAVRAGSFHWGIVPSGNVGTGENHLVSVAVNEAGNAWAVGHSADAEDKNGLTLIERFDGSSWTVVPSPNGTTDGNNFLGGIAVVGGELWAVGTFDGPDAAQTLILHSSR
jgi:hypothetical protein